ncbi:MAG: TIGR03618 family F420-dependent PPOX class oxidoreductase [Dehalococcoidia bacterium]|nr:TIGR03618 family F420-dependent PPOX class oxidoreductase [Dehalococcoidia bacterium]
MEFDAEALAILEGRHVAVLATLVRGAPAMACVWYGFDQGDLVVSTPAGRRKSKNVRDDPRVALLIDVRDAPHVPAALGYRGVEVRGRASVEDDPGARLRRAIVARYLNPLPVEFEARLQGEERSIIRIRPERVRLWDYTRGR